VKDAGAEAVALRLDAGNIGCFWKDHVSEALFKVRDVSQLARGGSDFVSAFERRLGPDAAETARCAGDEPNLFHIAPFKLLYCVALFRPAHNAYFQDQ
jgi:hypothetical protein